MKQSKIILAAVTLFCVGLLTAAVVVLFGKVGFFHSDTDRPTTVSIGGQPYPAQLSAFTVTNSDFDYSQLAQFHSLQSVDVTAVEDTASVEEVAEAESAMDIEGLVKEAIEGIERIKIGYEC